MVKGVTDWGDTHTSTTAEGHRAGTRPSGAGSPPRAVPSTQSMHVCAAVPSEKSKMQTLQGGTTPWGKHHPCEHVLSCTHVSELHEEHLRNTAIRGTYIPWT